VFETSNNYFGNMNELGMIAKVTKYIIEKINGAVTIDKTSNGIQYVFSISTEAVELV
jgi:hypothetical protein